MARENPFIKNIDSDECDILINSFYLSVKRKTLNNRSPPGQVMHPGPPIFNCKLCSIWKEIFFPSDYFVVVAMNTDF